MIVAFTGHRPDKLVGRIDAVNQCVAEFLDRVKPDKVISGMARGVDTIAALKAREKKIPYVAAVPFMSQVTNHSDEDCATWVSLIQDAVDVKIVCEGGYAVWKFQKRNEWMVDNCDLLVAVWDGSRGGTANCIDYAKKVGRPIEYLNWRS